MSSEVLNELCDQLSFARHRAQLCMADFMNRLTRRQGMAFMGPKQAIPRSKMHRYRYEQWVQAERMVRVLDRRASFRVIK